LIFAATTLALGASRLSAQVGHIPSRTPYLDLEYRHEWTFYGGYYTASTDPAGVAPRSAPMFGSRYDLRLGGPAYFTVNLAQVQSDRRVIDPKKKPAERLVGTESWPIYLADVGITLNLTGFKSYHHFVPTFGFALGIASDFKGKADVGLYKFGTPFALSVGTGVKWVPASARWQARLDLGERLYQIKYPNSYYTTETTDAPVLPATQAKNLWKANSSITFGVSYLFFR
jgi:hypothetical protein